MERENRIWTVPNALSLLRLFILIPILVFLAQEEPIWALFFMILGVATDFLDGYIARKFDQRSNLGRIADPVIDKINVLTVSLFLVLSKAYFFPMWYFLFLLIRELLVMLAGLWVIRGRQIVIESNRAGKNSAFANGMVVILYVFKIHSIAEIGIWIAFILTLISSWSYFRVFLRQIHSGNSVRDTN
jgi:CDP-diacylglycerol--glycerol-3-phosphate 3-phosphatidyltransferase